MDGELNTPFRPAWWLRNPHAQTLWPVLLRKVPRPPCRREGFATADGDFVELDWLGPAGAPTVILLHGLSGSSRSVYLRALQHSLAQAGFATVALNFRGCGGQPNNTARCYHSGDTQDLDQLYRHLRASQPHTPLAAVGFSLGGNVLLKWLGESQPPELFAAVAVSVPYLLNRCADRMDQGFSRVYRDSLIGELKGYMAAKLAHLQTIGAEEEAEKLRRLGDLAPLKSFWDFDGRVIAGLYGFRDAADYYAQSSCRQFLPAISTPTLLLQAQDDPFVPADAIPSPAELPPCVHLQASRHGGHLGFVAHPRWNQPQHWWQQRIEAFLAERRPG